MPRQFICRDICSSVCGFVFKEPVHVGELVTFRATINHTGRTSMEVGIRVEAENIRTGHRRHTNSCYFSMVAVDEAGKPVRVPALNPTDPVAIKRYKAAELRRTLRREFAERLEAVAATGNDVERITAG